MSVLVVIGYPAASLDGRDIYIGPTTGLGSWEPPGAPTLRRELVQSPFQKPPRLTSARDRSVHVPRIHEITGRKPPVPNRSD